MFIFLFSSRRRHTRSLCDWSSDVCSSDLALAAATNILRRAPEGSGVGRALGTAVEERLGRFELALGGSALILRHGRESLAFAGVETLAVMVATLAGALALAGVRADAVAHRVRSVSCA